MEKFTVLSDSSCDIPARMAKQNMIGIVPLKVSFDRVHKLTEGVDIQIDEFYNRLKTEPKTPKTYYPTVREYVGHFKAALAEGKDVLCLCLSSKLSKGYECACSARDILAYANKQNKVVVMDTLLAAGAQAALTLNAARLRDKGLTIDDAYKKLEALRDGSVTIFTVESLEQLARGGRMSKATATMGALLHINPIIYMENGALVSRDKAIGREKAVHKLERLVIEAIDKKMNDYEFTLFHSRSLAEAQKIEHDLKSIHGAKWFNPTVEVGMSIGAHTGASVLAINCMKKIV